jgi:hypothetical protein
VSGVVLDRLENYISDGDLTIDDIAYQIITARPFADAMKQAGIDASTFASRAGFTELESLENK